jgi:outer membrane receptor protein involved in Fe transport
MQLGLRFCCFSEKLSSLILEVVSPQVSRRFRLFTAIALVTSAALPALSQQAPDLTQKSLEDLMNIQVTSVSKREQTTSQAAAAVFVISRDDIRRSGALNIPDLLRMVPGLDVAQIDASRWAVTARGFNGQFSNKLLVLIDGRAVYNPIFAGVFWDSQNVLLDNIERIEVIRGPGAAVWGSNAVNGVISIITRTATSTNGGFVSGAAGNTSTGPGAIGYGGTVRSLGAYRVYANGFQYNDQLTFAGLNGQDHWRLARAGFRTDSTPTAKDSLTTWGRGLPRQCRRDGHHAHFTSSPGNCDGCPARCLLRLESAQPLESHLLVAIGYFTSGLFRPNQSRRYHLLPRFEHLRYRFSTPCSFGRAAGYCLGTWLPT